MVGYKGRVVIAEVLFVDDTIKEAVHQGHTSPREISKIARQKGMLSLVESGIKRVEEGVTSLEEVLAVASE
jgi:type II secretory ATPase GspE/PulE/Tfp pilus assembly ATPase PilB-like protein